jgi:hypothetical protein
LVATAGENSWLESKILEFLGGFGTTQTSAGVTPFGQNSFNKPAGAAAGFQSTGFGGSGGTSLFGGTTSTQSTGLFGATAAPAFGQQQQQQQTTAFSGMLIRVISINTIIIND